jgi:DNA end-binding protein Ku
MKAIWKGYLKCSLVTVPVKMFNAVRARPLQFHLYHRDCGSKIRQEMICPVHGRRLASDEVVRGYQYGKEMHVVITDEDLEKASRESTDTIEILKFVAAGQINPIYYADSHYLVPDGQAGAEAFALFHRAMLEAQKSALARVVLHSREHLLNIRPLDGAMVAFTLHYPEEIQAIQEIEEAEAGGGVQISEDNLAMARAILEHLSGDFVPEQYLDEYTRTLKEIIRAKAEGKEIKVEPHEERTLVVSLMESLKQNVQETARGAAVPKQAMATAGRQGQDPAKARKTG